MQLAAHVEGSLDFRFGISLLGQFGPWSTEYAGIQSVLNAKDC